MYIKEILVLTSFSLCLSQPYVLKYMKQRHMKQRLPMHLERFRSYQISIAIAIAVRWALFRTVGLFVQEPVLAVPYEELSWALETKKEDENRMAALLLQFLVTSEEGKQVTKVLVVFSSQVNGAYSMVWWWIWNLFQDFYIFSLLQSTSKNTSEINSIFIVKNLEFSVYYIFYGFNTFRPQLLNL